MDKNQPVVRDRLVFPKNRFNSPRRLAGTRAGGMCHMTQGFSRYQTVFGDWIVCDYLGGGSGGRTAVFRLERSKLGWRETCALKIVTLMEEAGRLDARSGQQQQAYRDMCRERSLQAAEEVRLMARLSGCTNVVDYLDYQVVDWEEEHCFGQDLLIRMELLCPLSSMIRDGLPYDRNRVLNLGQDICRALIRCHGDGIIHRDIKPGNIFCNQRLDFKLGDFGIARLLACGEQAYTAIGTRAYAAPEQFAMGGGYDARVDLYSLGLTLYALCNENCLPFARDQYVREDAVLGRLREEILPVPSKADLELARVILKACSRRPEDRYPSALAMYDALEALRPTRQTSPPAAAETTLRVATTALLTAPILLEDGQPPEQVPVQILFQRGQDYKLGRGVAKDLFQAAVWHEMAAKRGHAQAQYEVGLCYEYGSGMDKNPEKAAEWFKKAAHQGNADAQCALGTCFYNGTGVEQDYVQAAQWYERAACQGHARGAHNLGMCLEFGRGVKGNPEKAVEWYEKAAHQGNAAAQCALGTCFYRGTGVERDYAQAVQWYKRAALQGHARGSFNLGLCLEFGKGVEKDLEKAVKWYEKAARRGSRQACYRLGQCLEWGISGPPDIARAVRWYQEGSKLGDLDCRKALLNCFQAGTQ